MLKTLKIERGRERREEMKDVDLRCLSMI